MIWQRRARNLCNHLPTPYVKYILNDKRHPKIVSTVDKNIFSESFVH